MSIVWGNHFIPSVSLKELIPFIHQRELFQYHWGFKTHSELAEKIFSRFVIEETPFHFIEPRAIYGIYACEVQQETLFIYRDLKHSACLVQFHFPRQKQGSHRCITDYFNTKREGTTRDWIAFQVVTLGHISSDYEQKLFQENRYQDYLYRYGFHAVLAEALAQWIFTRVCQEVFPTLSEPIGKRFSFGYSGCPDLQQQKRLLSLLNAETIGITQTEADQLSPVHSTAALMSFDQNARYFHVSPAGVD